MNAIVNLGPLVSVGRFTGHLFEKATGDGICFVPVFCIEQRADGALAFRENSYVMSGWARRNGMFSVPFSSHRVFPDVECPVHDFDSPAVFDFLERIRTPVPI